MLLRVTSLEVRINPNTSCVVRELWAAVLLQGDSRGQAAPGGAGRSGQAAEGKQLKAGDQAHR